jgi:hypothetical protein
MPQTGVEIVARVDDHRRSASSARFAWLRYARWFRTMGDRRLHWSAATL